MAQSYRGVFSRANKFVHFPHTSSHRNSVRHTSDNYPSGVTAVAIVSTLVCATWTDHTGVRWPVLVYMSISCIVASICILVWSSPIGLKFFGYCMSPDMRKTDNYRTSLIIVVDLAGASLLARQPRLRESRLMYVFQWTYIHNLL